MLYDLGSRGEIRRRSRPMGGYINIQILAAASGSGPGDSSDVIKFAQMKVLGLR